MFRVASWSTTSMIASGSDEIFETKSFIFVAPVVDIMIKTVEYFYRSSLAHVRLDPNAMDRSSPVQKISADPEAIIEVVDQLATLNIPIWVT